jgi:dihydroneopterin aldolase
VDRIHITGLRVLGRHGVLAEEQLRPQPFELDITLAFDAADAAASDDLDATIDYAAVAATAAGIVERERYTLIERVAARICDVLLADARVESATVTVRKPKAPLGLDAASVGVTLTRSRSR